MLSPVTKTLLTKKLFRPVVVLKDLAHLSVPSFATEIIEPPVDVYPYRFPEVSDCIEYSDDVPTPLIKKKKYLFSTDATALLKLASSPAIAPAIM
jgi:hypothetical protein